MILGTYVNLYVADKTIDKAIDNIHPQPLADQLKMIDNIAQNVTVISQGEKSADENKLAIANEVKKEEILKGFLHFFAFFAFFCTFVFFTIIGFFR